MSNLRVSIIQQDIALGIPDENIANAQKWIALAAKTNPDIIVLPELWNTGYALDRIRTICDHDGAMSRAVIGQLAREHHTHILAGSVADERDGNVFNTSYMFDRNGDVAATYSKTHLFRLMDEHHYLTAGNTSTTWMIDDIPCGAMICYDLRFPELTRKLALAGAQIAFVPAEWPHPRLAHWRQLQIARAIENQMFIVSCNRVGQSDDTTFFGHSMVIDPWGEIVFEADDQPGLTTVELHLDAVADIRSRIPIFQDRRPELY